MYKQSQKNALRYVKPKEQLSFKTMFPKAHQPTGANV